MKLKRQFTRVGIIALATTLSAFPLHAAIEQHTPASVLETITTPLALSWSGIWDRLRRKEVPGGSRGNRSQPTVCAVVPGTLFDEDTKELSPLQVWGLNPVFVWQDQWSRLEVFRSDDHTILLSRELDPEARHLVYSNVEDAMPLEPGGSYYWRLSRDDSDGQLLAFGETSFRTLDAEQRLELDAELAGLDAAESALSQRVNIFAERELWADVVRELYTVDDLPEELKALKDEITGHDFCDQSGEVSLTHHQSLQR